MVREDAQTSKRGGNMQRIHRGSSVLLLVVALAGTAPLVADTVTLQPIKDNTLYEPIAQDSFLDKSDGAGPTMFTGRVKDADADPGAGTRAALRRGVLAFNIAANIPAGATINGVQLTMYCDKVKLTTAFSVSLRRLTSDWGEGTSNTGNSQQGRGEPPTTGDATWHHTFYPGQLWTTPGGDYSGTISATRTVGNTGFYTWGSTSGLVADVQSWLNTPAQNYGWIVLGDESRTETTKRFGTRENTGSTGGVTWRPQLVVSYTPATTVGGCCQGGTCSLQTPANCTALGGIYHGDGSSYSPNPCVVATGACCANNASCSEVTLIGPAADARGGDTHCGCARGDRNLRHLDGRDRAADAQPAPAHAGVGLQRRCQPPGHSRAGHRRAHRPAGDRELVQQPP